MNKDAKNMHKVLDMLEEIDSEVGKMLKSKEPCVVRRGKKLQKILLKSPYEIRRWNA